MSLFQELKRVLDFANAKVENPREHSGVELQSLNARYLQQPLMISLSLPIFRAIMALRNAIQKSRSIPVSRARLQVRFKTTT